MENELQTMKKVLQTMENELHTMERELMLQKFLFPAEAINFQLLELLLIRKEQAQEAGMMLTVNWKQVL